MNRFITTDPLLDQANPLNYNPYTYADNNPITKSDPTGLEPHYQEDGTWSDHGKTYGTPTKHRARGHGSLRAPFSADWLKSLLRPTPKVTPVTYNPFDPAPAEVDHSLDVVPSLVVVAVVTSPLWVPVVVEGTLIYTSGASVGTGLTAFGGAVVATWARFTAGQAAAKAGTGLSDAIAATFSGGRYTTSLLAEDTVVFRAGVQGKPFGQFFSTEKPVGVVQTRIDKAIPPYWSDGTAARLDTGYAIRIPKGTTIYSGEVANQGGIYMGGTGQIFVREPWNIPGAEVVGSWPLR